ncbi:cell division protein FtsL [Dongia rigui]|uniref:Cell division protein FtsL n=1 Tax=Dongia rigui TaxID=940149 RepID=A0ABU5DUZ8_9PROT|nr:hypothetical protein [Dongia rigui]MDY0871136.1 hypothetical protein [Dongia rigui]
MIRIGTIVWFVVLALLGVGLFQVKYAVQAKERELRKVNRQIAADRDAMRVLEAEWSYLNDPVRLADLTRRHTDLTPVMASQIATFDSLAPRPADAPEAAPALPPIAAAPQADVVATPVAAKSIEPAPAAENDPVFSTSSAKAAEPAAAEEDDATIRAILQDMQSNQGTDAQPEAGKGKTEPANETGVE